MSYQDRMHSHVDSADTNQDTPAQSHTETEDEGVLKEKTIRHSHQHASRQGHKGSGVLMPLTSLHACMHAYAEACPPLFILDRWTKRLCMCVLSNWFILPAPCVCLQSVPRTLRLQLGAHHFIYVFEDTLKRGWVAWQKKKLKFV